MGDDSKKKAPASALKQFLSGACGGIGLVLVGHPFDTVKVRLQTSNEFTSMMQCVRYTIQRDGIKGLFRGMATPLVGVTPVFAVCFWGYDVGQKIQRSILNMDPAQKLSMTGIVLAGGFSAIPTTVLMTPMERIKVMLQIQGTHGKGAEKKFTGPGDVAKHLWKEGGVRALYKGTALTLLRDIPGSMAYFGAYEGLKRTLTPKGSKPEDLNPLIILFAGGMAGVANWVVAIPPDVLKSRYQTAPEGTYKSIMDVLTQLLKNEGPGALFKGVGPAMIRAFPANAACFLGAELSMKLMNYLW